MSEPFYKIYDLNNNEIAAIPVSTIIKLSDGKTDVEIGCKSFRLSQIKIKEPFPNSDMVQKWINNEIERIKKEEEMRNKLANCEKILVQRFKKIKHSIILTPENASTFPFIYSQYKKGNIYLDMETNYFDRNIIVFYAKSWQWIFTGAERCEKFEFSHYNHKEELSQFEEICQFCERYDMIAAVKKTIKNS